MPITHRIPGLMLVDHEFEVPLDHDAPDKEQITVFARELIAPGKERDALPWLVYLQGGPGFGSPRPTSKSGWLERALECYRVLLLDQRGTGKSTPVLTQTLAALPSDASLPQAQADYLKHFRADAIVRDAELIRRELAGHDTPWAVLGQSFGGFCAAHYLSAAPEGLREVMFTGGLPPLEASADDVYRATYCRVADRNRRYYERYPDDVARVRDIADYLAENDVRLPGGGRLSVRRFQQLGLSFGASDGFEHIHYLVENAFVRGRSGVAPSYVFLREVENASYFEARPIYALLHEAIYCQNQASRWAAHRMRAEFPEFDSDARDPLYFTGEMVYPWMFDDYEHLGPLRDAAEILAEHADWPRLYDLDRLGKNTVPSVAAVYYDDMYVELSYSEQAARAIRGLRTWVTSEHEHDAIRASGQVILDRLIKMLRGEA